MTNLDNRKILLGITGGIAAYKGAILARRLMDAGAEVRVVMTAGAQSFITPLTFQALTGNPVHTELLDTDAEAAMGHIELARWPDLILIAPASANTVARLANGLADDLLSTLCLATDRPIFVAPAMNRLMWANPATKDNVTTLVKRGLTILGPGVGDQACGEVGAGRLLEPEQIRDTLIELTSQLPVHGDGEDPHPQHCDLPATRLLQGVNVLITAGPTREAIDPVRYLSNRSSGKMGFAVAQAAQRLGANVTLIAGPVNLATPSGVERVDVVSARDMHKAVMDRKTDSNIFISVAAVADYRIADVANRKIKKTQSDMSLKLERNPDILADVASSEHAPFCVGFAAETNNVEKYARDKLQRKKLQMIAANHVARKDNAVFNSDTNALEVYWPDDGHASIATDSKKIVAEKLLALIAVQYRP